MMEDVPVSDDRRVVYRGSDNAVSFLLSQGPHSSFPVALKYRLSLFFNSQATTMLAIYCVYNWGISMHYCYETECH